MFEYSRSGNPTRNAMEECFASLEKAKYGKTNQLLPWPSPIPGIFLQHSFLFACFVDYARHVSSAHVTTITVKLANETHVAPLKFISFYSQWEFWQSLNLSFIFAYSS